MNASDVRQIAAVLVSLKNEVAAVVKIGLRPSWVAVENQIGVLIRLSQRAITQESKVGYRSRRIFKRGMTGDDCFKRVPGRNDRSWSAKTFLGIGDGTGNWPDARMWKRKCGSQEYGGAYHSYPVIDHTNLHL